MNNAPFINIDTGSFILVAGKSSIQYLVTSIQIKLFFSLEDGNHYVVMV